MPTPRRAARLAVGLLPLLLGRAAPLPEHSLLGNAAPGTHILLEKTAATGLAASAAAPLQVRSDWPVTVARYDPGSLLSHPLAAGEGAVLVTSDCDTGATAAVPVVDVREGAVTVTLEGGGRDAAASVTPFLAPSSYKAAWYEAGQGLYPERALSEEELALLPPLLPNEAVPAAACTTRAACDARRADLGIAAALAVGPFPTKGCFRKEDRVFWGTGGSRLEIIETNLPGAQERVWCEEPRGGDAPPGTCASDEECAAKVRSQWPAGGSAAVGGCGCYAASDTHPFDECEGRATCRDVQCDDSCAGFEAYCKRNRCALQKVRPLPAKQPCLTLAQCKERSADSGFGTVIAGNHATKGCFRKKDRAYWGASGSVAEMAATDLPSAQERLWCGEGGVGGQLLGEDCEIGPAATSLRACSGDSAHCQLRTGVCNNESGLHEGICRKKPTTCSKDFKPVCGCDQKTYSNECMAHAAGVSVSRKEACDKKDVQEQLMPGDNCEIGPAASFSRSCGGGGGGRKAHCQLRTGVCNNKSDIYEGVCRELPEMCIAEVKPVCGCDEKTYSNKCKAHAKGVNVAREGACDPPRKRVACLTKSQCDARRKELGIPTLDASPDYPSKGCFTKGNRAYWSAGSPAAMAEELPGQRERLWCEVAAGSRLSLQQSEVTAAVQVPEVASSASSLRWMLMYSLFGFASPSKITGGKALPPREGRALDTCSYNVEILLTGCDEGSPASIEVSAPRVRTINSRVKNKATTTYALREVSVEGGEKYYAKDYKHTAKLVFSENEAVEVASPAAGRFTAVPPFEPYQCDLVVPGRPFVDSDGRGLLAPQCSGVQCEGRASSWSGGTVAQDPSVGNITDDDGLGREWSRNALGEHASVASFAAFSIALMSNQAPSDLVEDALNAALDEVRHAKVSFEIASSLVGKDLGPGPLPPSSIEFKQDMKALAVAVAREGCVDETLSALAAAAECELIDSELENKEAWGNKYSGVTDEVLVWIRSELRTIAFDEGNHSALAWRTLDWVCNVDAEACEAAKQGVLNESALTSAFRHRFSDFEEHPELLERMLAAWTQIYSRSRVLNSEDAGVACIVGNAQEVFDRDSIEGRSLLSTLVENISHRSQRE